MPDEVTSDESKCFKWHISDRPAHPQRPYEVVDVEMTLPDDDYLTIQTDLGAFGPTYLVASNGRSLLGIIIAFGASDPPRSDRFMRFRALVPAGEIRKMAQEWVLQFGVRGLLIRVAL